jgi:predicted ArsR family transcriptional regulator
MGKSKLAPHLNALLAERYVQTADDSHYAKPPPQLISQDAAKGYREIANELADRIRDVAENCLGLEVPGTTHVEMLDALEREYLAERRIAEQLRVRLEDATRQANKVPGLTAALDEATYASRLAGADPEHVPQRTHGEHRVRVARVAVGRAVCWSTSAKGCRPKATGSRAPSCRPSR